MVIKVTSTVDILRGIVFFFKGTTFSKLDMLLCRSVT